MSKAHHVPGQLALDFNAPPKLAPRPPRLLSPLELREQTDRNTRSMQAKLRALSPSQKRAIRVRDPMDSDYGWRIAKLLEAIPDFEKIGGFGMTPGWYELCEIMKECGLPHGSVMYLRCHHTMASVLLTDRTAEGRYQDLPAV